jgi:hypothetical protein
MCLMSSLEPVCLCVIGHGWEVGKCHDVLGTIGELGVFTLHVVGYDSTQCREPLSLYGAVWSIT